MKLFSARALFILLLFWTVFVIIFFTSRYLCCWFSSRLYWSLKKPDYKILEDSHNNLFASEEEHLDNSLDFKCNSTVVRKIFNVVRSIELYTNLKTVNEELSLCCKSIYMFGSGYLVTITNFSKCFYH